MQHHHRRHHCIARIVGIWKIVFFIHVVYDAMIDDKSTPHSASELFVWIMACNEYDNYDLCTYHFRIIIKLLALLASIWCLTFVILPRARASAFPHTTWTDAFRPKTALARWLCGSGIVIDFFFCLLLCCCCCGIFFSSLFYPPTIQTHTLIRSLAHIILFLGP